MNIGTCGVRGFGKLAVPLGGPSHEDFQHRSSSLEIP